jgi:hypothetical protein
MLELRAAISDRAHVQILLAQIDGDLGPWPLQVDVRSVTDVRLLADRHGRQHSDEGVMEDEAGAVRPKRELRHEALKRRVAEVTLAALPRFEPATSTPAKMHQRHLCSVAATRCVSVRVRGSSTSTVRCSVGFGVAVTNVTPSGAWKRCHMFCGTITTMPALSA